MAEPGLKDRMFPRLMRGLVETGRAPHCAELARALGLSTEDGRLILPGFFGTQTRRRMLDADYLSTWDARRLMRT
jgi:hypothetical protein